MTRNNRDRFGSPIKVGGNDMIHPKEVYGTLDALERNTKYIFDQER